MERDCIMENNRSCQLHCLSELAVKALIYEVSITPKPGLVDRYNSGAHKDMDFYTFLESSYALTDYFYQVTKAGYYFKGSNIKDLFESIRKPGMEAEKVMYDATGGVNTHKGLIFSLGILLSSAGYLFQTNKFITIDGLIETSKNMTKGLVYQDFKHVTKEAAITNGEKLYADYGITGIRGEAESGFITAIEKGYPAFIRAKKAGYSMNDAGIMALFAIMETLDDTNILARHNFATLNYVKECAVKINDIKHFPEKLIEIQKLDQEFINKNISPGGAADLLAITLVLYYIDSKYNKLENKLSTR